MTPASLLAAAVWGLAFWCWSFDFPRPFDDCKEAVVYAGGALLILATSRRPKTVLAPPGRSLCGAYFVWVVASFVGGEVAPAEGLLAVARLLLVGGLALGFARLERAERAFITAAMVPMAALVAVGFLVEASGLGSFRLSGTDLFPPLGHVTYAGEILAFHIPLAIGLAVRARGIASAGFLLAAGLILVGVWVCGTRASLAGVFVATCVWFIFQRTRGKTGPSLGRQLGVAAGLVAVLVMVEFLVPSGLRGLSTFGRMLPPVEIWELAPPSADVESSLSVLSNGRLRSWTRTLDLVAERAALGWGPGTFRFVYPAFAWRGEPDTLSRVDHWYMHPHNELLHQAAELGLPGALLAACLALWLVSVGVRKTLSGDPEALPALAALVVLFVAWQFSTGGLHPLSRLCAAFAAGSLLSSPEAHSKKITGWRRGVRATSALAIVTAGVALAGYSLALVSTTRQAQAMTRKESFSAARWALRLAPGTFVPTWSAVVTLLEHREPERAGFLLEGMVADYPHTPLVLHAWGLELARRGDIDGARVAFERARLTDPGFAAPREALDLLSHDPGAFVH